MQRFVVTELTGYLRLGAGRGGNDSPGTSFHVIDRAYNHKLIATYRTEDVRGGLVRAMKREKQRTAALEHAARLNEAVS